MVIRQQGWTPSGSLFLIAAFRAAVSGLLLGTEAPVMTPNGVEFSLRSFNLAAAYLGHVGQLLSELVCLTRRSFCTAVGLAVCLLTHLQLLCSYSQRLCSPACKSPDASWLRQRFNTNVVMQVSRCYALQ